MVTFDSAVAGTAHETWRAALTERVIPPIALEADRLVVLAAHPDDETLGATGLMATAVAAGVPVEVVVVTDGGASHPDTADLARRRAAEVEAAVGLIAPSATVTMLGFPDGQVRENRVQVTEALLPFVEGDGTLVVAPWRSDGHRDHRVLGEIAASISARLLEYPIWFWHWGTPHDLPWADLRELGVDPDVKRRAIAAHASQVLSLDGREPVLRADFLENFSSGTEYYISTSRLAGAYFDDLYERHDDPWGFESRWYEERKRAVLLASLPAARYASALEIGCSTGLLTEHLAARCDDLVAVDLAGAAVAVVRARLGDRARVEVRDVTTDFPRGEFELVVLSEVGYYFDASVLERVLDDIEAGLSADGTLVACHWRHPVHGYLASGDAVHRVIGARGLSRVVRHEEEDFVLEVFSRTPDSVARREGLV